MQEAFILIKLFLSNSFFIFQGFLKYNSFNSFMWVIFDEATYGNGYSNINWAFGLNRINRVLSVLDPLYVYDNIYAAIQN